MLNCWHGLFKLRGCKVPYAVYATNKDGEGYTQLIGTYDDLSEVNLHVGMFAEDVVVTVEDVPGSMVATAPVPAVVSAQTVGTIPNVKVK